MANTLIGRLTPTNNMGGTLTNESRLTGQLGGLGAVVTYASLPDKPSINNVELVGNKTTSDLNISYNDLRDQPVIPDVGEIDERLDDLEGDMTSLSGRVTTAEGNITTLQGDTGALDTRLTTAEGNITSLGGRVTTAEGNITTLQGDTGALDTRLTTAEGDITSLGGRLTTAEGNITSLDGRVTTNEGDISDLQGDMLQAQSDITQLNSSSVDNIRLGNFMGTIQRYGRLRIISIYNANGLQAATSVQLTSTDYPTVDVSVFNWVPITESPQTYGTRKLSLSTAGVLSTDNSVVRGGWVMVYIAKN